jgi:hypothetical protein
MMMRLRAYLRAGNSKSKFMDSANNRCKGMFPTALRNRDGHVRTCGAIPPPYFATPASWWWFERHTYLAVQCQLDIQSDTLRDLDNFYPSVMLPDANGTRTGARSAMAHKSIVEDGDYEYHGDLDMTKFEPVPAACAQQLRPEALRLRVLPMNAFLTKCSHKRPIDWAAEGAGSLIAAHANCAVWKGTAEDRIKDKILWLNQSKLWFLD